MIKYVFIFLYIRFLYNFNIYINITNLLLIYYIIKNIKIKYTFNFI